MTLPLKSKPGLTSASALSIPTTWDATWFRNFISNLLKGADVRNSISGPGISVTGTISSPYATISIGGSGPVTLPGPVTIPATAGSVSLTVDGASGQVALAVVSGSSGTTGAADIYVTRAGSTANSVAQGPNIDLADTVGGGQTLLQQSGGQSELWQYNSGWNQVWYVTTVDSVVFNQSGQFKGYSGGAPGFTGSGMEVGFSGGTGYLQAYNRTGATSLPLIATGSTISLNINGVANTGFSVIASAANAVLTNTSTTFAATYGGVSGLIVNNLSSAMQSVLDFGKNGVLSGRIRNDYQGNMSFVTTASGVHDFFCGGDSGVGSVILQVNSAGLSLTAAATTTSPAAGGAGALPATPAGYIAITLNGTARRIPYYT